MNRLARNGIKYGRKTLYICHNKNIKTKSTFAVPYLNLENDYLLKD